MGGKDLSFPIQLYPFRAVVVAAAISAAIAAAAAAVVVVMREGFVFFLNKIDLGCR